MSAAILDGVTAISTVSRDFKPLPCDPRDSQVLTALAA